MSVSPRWRSVAAAGAVAAAVVLVDVVTQWLADTQLPGAPVDLRIGRLQLSYNTGVAFSLGDGLRTWAVLALGGVVTGGVVVAIVTGRLRPAAPAGLILGGAVANIVDRAGDGVVTDFLWLGWFPTFNLANTAITLGLIVLLWASWRADHSPSREQDAAPQQAPADLDRSVPDGAS